MKWRKTKDIIENEIMLGNYYWSQSWTCKRSHGRIVEERYWSSGGRERCE